MLAGLTDQAAASQRHLPSHRPAPGHDLMSRAGVEARIQLGWQAARRGWA
ncbi:hypothetical protein [Kitasatospora sp. NPDC085879]